MGFAVSPGYQVQPRPARILLVEDDPLLQDIFGSALASQGHEVETASDGLNALWKVREGTYDLVLCDYKLPEINGLAMVRLVRDLVNTAVRPALVALTGAPAFLMNEALPGRAFDEVIAKPVDLERLVSIVQRHLDARTVATTRRDAGSGGLSESRVDYDTGPGATSQGGHSPPPCILVVEDDEVQRSVLKFVLEGSGFSVKVAVDGFHAVRMLRDGAFDLALIDYQLPEMDGLATGKLILNLVNEDVRPRMIAFTSAPSNLAGRLAGIDNAFDEVVAKSDGLPALLAALERHLRSSPRVATRRAAEIVFPSAA